jgi:CubicO group peptidase (beta-lactamase class C family)
MEVLETVSVCDWNEGAFSANKGSPSFPKEPPMLAPTAASPESAGMSQAALDRLEAHLKNRYVEAGRLPGTQLVVYRRGKVVHNAANGFADVERKVPVKDDTIFRIYSMTKPITSVAFMMLVEEGRVALDEPVHKYIPDWKNLGVFVAGSAPAFVSRPPSRPMLIIDLLRHTSGLTYGFQQRSNVDAAYREKKLAESGTLEGMIEELAKIPLEFSPGDAWNYSVSTDVLGYLIGKMSGLPFEQFLKERIFDPLGMRDTDFYVPTDKAHRLAACYSADPPGKLTFNAVERKGTLTLQDDPATSAYLAKPSFISGGGGLCATAADYLTFCRALINGGELGGVRLLGPKTLKLMTSNHLPGGVDLPAMSRAMFSEATYSGMGFGLGFAVNLDPAQMMLAGSVGEYNWGGAASTAFWIDPAEELIAIFMTQLLPSSAYPIRRELRTMIYAAIMESNF